MTTKARWMAGTWERLQKLRLTRQSLPGKSTAAEEQQQNTGVSPLRRAIRLRGSGRDDVAFYFAFAIGVLVLVAGQFGMAQTKASSEAETPFHTAGYRPLEIGALVQSGFGVTEDRNSFKFLMAGVQAGKVLTGNYGPGIARGNFEYAVQVFPLWRAYTPKFQRETCAAGPFLTCSAPYTVGGTFTGFSITPILLRWNFVGTRKFSPYLQGGGGMIWTNHKFPAFGGPPYNPINDGVNSDTSVWNFTPQFGVGAHYFLSPRRSIDFGANAVHISSSSLGDKNPGVNASVQFSVGYTWWR